MATKLNLISSICLIAVFLLLANVVSAHEHRTYMIGNNHYELTVGSLNEPVYVDDKSGVQLMVTLMPHVMKKESDDHSAHGDASENTPVLGLDKTLKVELQANNQKKTLDFKAAWGKPGEYHAVFYPTQDAQYSYRIFGEINGTKVDLQFDCNPKGHVMVADENEKTIKISEGVTLLAQSGSFGCPQSRAEVQFPSQAHSSAQMTHRLGTSGQITLWSVALSSLAIILSVVAIVLRKPLQKK